MILDADCGRHTATRGQIYSVMPGRGGAGVVNDVTMIQHRTVATNVTSLNSNLCSNIRNGTHS